MVHSCGKLGAAAITSAYQDQFHSEEELREPELLSNVRHLASPYVVHCTLVSIVLGVPKLVRGQERSEVLS